MNVTCILRGDVNALAGLRAVNPEAEEVEGRKLLDISRGTSGDAGPTMPAPRCADPGVAARGAAPRG